MRKLYLALITVLSLGLFVQANAQITSFPYSEDFESGQGGWTTGGTNSSWAFGTPSKLGQTTAPSGSNAFVLGGLSGSYNNNEDSYLKSPVFDFSGLASVKLSFTINYYTESCCDYLYVQYSVDNGTTWSDLPEGLFSQNYNSLYKGGGGSKNQLVSNDVSSLAGLSEVKFRFHFVSDGSVIDPGVIIDDIRLEELPDNDIGVKYPDSLFVNYGDASNENIAIDLMNGGNNDQSGFNLAYKIDNGSIVREAYSGTLSHLSFNPFVFSSQANLNTVGKHEIKVWTELSNDENIANDTTTYAYYTYHLPALTLPYRVSFDGTELNSSYLSIFDTAGLFKDGAFEFRTAKGIQLQQGTNNNILNGPYLRFEDTQNGTSYLKWHLNLSGYTTAANKLLFKMRYYHYDYQNPEDKIWVRGNDQSPWLELYSWATIPRNQVTKITLNLTDTLLAHGQEFSSNTEIRIGNNGYYGGTYISYLSVEEVEAKDLSIERSLTSKFFYNAETTKSVSALIFNNGYEDQTNFSVAYALDGGAVNREVVNKTAPKLDTVSYHFTQKADFSQKGEHHLKLWTELTGDSNASNDTISQAVYSFKTPVLTLPYEATFDSAYLADSDNYLSVGDTAGLFKDGAFQFKSKDGGSLYEGLYDDNLKSNYLRLTDVNYGELSYLYWHLNLSNYDVSSNRVVLEIRYLQDDYQYSGNKIWIRGDEQSPWLELFNWATVNRNQATTKTLNLTDTLVAHGQQFSSNTEVRIGNEGSYGGILISKLSLKVINAKDLVADKILNTPYYYNADSTQIKVTFFNNGYEDQTAFPVSYQLDGGSVVQEIVSDTIKSLDTLTYTFSQDADLSQQGSHTLKLRSELSGDANPNNDLLESNVFNHVTSPLQLPYEVIIDSLTFDNSSNSIALAYEDTAGLFQDGLFEFQTEDQLYITSNDVNYDFYQGHVLSIVDQHYGAPSYAIWHLDLSNKSVLNNTIICDLSYFHQVYTDPDNHIWVRGDKGLPWLDLYKWDEIDREKLNRVNLNISDTLKAHGQEFSRNTEIRIGDVSHTWGVYITKMALFERYADDVTPLSTTLPQGAYNLSNADSIKVHLFNKGKNDQTNIPIGYQLDNQGVIRDTIAALSSLDTAQYFLTKGININSNGEHHFRLWTELPGDMDAQNDTITQEFYAYQTPLISLPYLVNFDSAYLSNYNSYLPLSGTDTFGLFKDYGFSFHTDNGALQEGYYNSVLEANALTIQDKGYGEPTYLFWHLNMGAMDTAVDNVGLRFRYYHRNSYGNANDAVWIRGNTGDPWVKIYLWSDIPEYTVNETFINITDSLKVHHQSFSDNTEIRIGDYGGGNGGISIDYLQLERIPDYRIALENIVEPVAELRNIFPPSARVSVKNDGLKDISDFKIFTKLDSSAIDSLSFSGTIVAGALDTVYANSLSGLYSSEKLDHTVKIWASYLDQDSVVQITDTTSKVFKYTRPSRIMDIPHEETFWYAPTGYTATGTEFAVDYGEAQSNLDFYDLDYTGSIEFGEDHYPTVYGNSNLIYYMDLSSFDTTKTIYFNLELGGELSSTSQVNLFIKGSQEDTLIALGKLSKGLNRFNITQSLKDGGQDYSYLTEAQINLRTNSSDYFKIKGLYLTTDANSVDLSVGSIDLTQAFNLPPSLCPDSIQSIPLNIPITNLGTDSVKRINLKIYNNSELVMDKDSLLNLSAGGRIHYNWEWQLSDTVINQLFLAKVNTLDVTDENTSNNLTSAHYSYLEQPSKPQVEQDGNGGLYVSLAEATAYQWYRDGVPINGETDSLIVDAKSGSYQVEVFNAIGCSRMSDAVIFTGIHQQFNLRTALYPNPVSNVLHVAVDKGYSIREAQLAIYDLNGQVVKQAKLDNSGQWEVPVKTLRNGYYLVKLQLNGHTIIDRFIKE